MTQRMLLNLKTKIAQYANSQSPVTAADLANSPFHVHSKLKRSFMKLRCLEYK